MYAENTLCGDTTLVLHHACFQIQIILLMHQNTFSDISIVSSLPSNREFNGKPEGSKYIHDIQIVSSALCMSDKNMSLIDRTHTLYNNMMACLCLGSVKFSAGFLKSTDLETTIL